MIESPRFHKLFPCVGLRGIACALGLLLCSAEAREVRILGGEWQYRFGDEPAEMVQLPHSWNTHDAAEGAQGRRDDAKSVNSLVYKRGAATCTRQLRLDKEPGKRYFLRCGGASIVSELIFNEIYHQPEPVQQQVNQEAELETLRDFVKAADPHRLVVAASNQPGRQKLNRNPELMVYLTSRRFAERRCSEVPVKVYSNADSVELFVNGQSCGSVKPDGQGRAIWPSVQPEPGQNLLSAIAKQGSATCSDSCTWLLRANSPTPQPREQYMADGIRKR